MRIDWWTLALQTINALVLIWLLARFLFRPVAGIIADRQQAARALIEDAQTARSAAIGERDRAAREAQEIVAARSEALKAVAAEAAAQKRTLLAAAQADADALRATALQQAATARALDERLAADQASLLAVDIARKLLDRLPESVRVAAFIDGLADGVAQLPGAARDELATEGAGLIIVVPRALSPEEEQRCHAVLAAYLSREAVIRFEIDPQLIAGLELRSPHAVVRNSFGAELMRIREALLDDSHIR